jgi:hypothetical protein
MTPRPMPLLLFAVGLLAALSSGCQWLYDGQVAAAERDCERLAMQSEVTACRQKLRAQQEAFRKARDQQERAEKARQAAAAH